LHVNTVSKKFWTAHSHCSDDWAWFSRLDPGAVFNSILACLLLNKVIYFV